MQNIIPSITETTAESLLKPTVQPSPQTLAAQNSESLIETALVVNDHPASVPSNLDQLLNNGSYRVKEEHALIQRRTVEASSILENHGRLRVK
jgi:hypothetical protein